MVPVSTRIFKISKPFYFFVYKCVWREIEVVSVSWHMCLKALTSFFKFLFSQYIVFLKEKILSKSITYCSLNENNQY